MKSDLMMNAAIELVERGWIPDWLTRRAIRNLCSKRLATLDAGSDQANRENIQTFIEAAKQSPIALVPEKANEQHYEVPAEFYQLVLGNRRKYSSCYWPEGVSTLDEAETAALRETCLHAQLEDGMQVLELGCGWGSLSLWIVENYPHCRVTAVSNSQSQRAAIEQQAIERGVADRLTVMTADMNDFATSQKFDRVMSVEMFEHMRNYQRLLNRIANWLTDDGKLFVHIFCHRQFVYEFSDQSADDWMARHFFTGGIMPGDDYLAQFNEHMQVTEQWRWDGRHYQRTSEAWLANLDQRRDQILPILAQTYGEQQAKRWLIRWRLFFLAVAELFGYRNGSEWYVSHYLLEPVSAQSSAGNAKSLQTPRDKYSAV
ncbi:SAM-dependent methyltransferase [Gimesia fumaroli]|jgi:cyclopropane-fatty-acyl-phospholipid synthase|uniref:Cyclopropane-fatty-acyl-phospholipid synthase n=1 Tax=Gimesia fumaroli TaxID=2527976 RepID=A0A518IA38_9PLAN|nr:cyclopropane-fatty-acyl-phospholipid synthase family protein [Gimesia fumaroli]QDV50003.1 Cyclopropane-fatty-acyl-phospholipid synthase [Gimesia fumaroli]